MKVEFKWDKPVSTITIEATGGDKGLLFIANEARRLMDPYIPVDNHMLASKVRTYVENGMGIVEYESPYAHYQYVGKVYVSSITGSPYAKKGEHKVPTGKDFKHSKFRHPLATSYWDKAMMTARKGDLAKAYQSYLRGGRT